MDIWFCSSPDTWCVLPIAERIIQLWCVLKFQFGRCLRRTDGFLGKWKHHSPSVFGAFWNLKSASVGQTFFLEKRSIIPRAIFCVCHGFVASFRSANHFDANTNLAEPYPSNDIVSQIVFCQTRRQHLLSRSKALSNISKQGILFQSEGILSDYVLRVIPDVYCQLRNELSNCGVFWNLKGVLRRSDGFLGKWKHHSPSVFGACFEIWKVLA